MAAVCLEDFVKPAMKALNKPVKDNAATILAKLLGETQNASLVPEGTSATNLLHDNQKAIYGI